jgi:predicted nucleic acid-binding protein
MILVDTSAWIEFLRQSGHPVRLALRRLLQRRAPLATTEVVIVEVLAGARTGLESRTNACTGLGAAR